MDSNTFSPANSSISTDLLHEALDAARVIVWEWDLRTQQVTSSSTLPQLPYGQSAMELQTLVHPDDREIYDRTLGTAILEQRSFVIEHRVLVAGREVHWHSLSGRVQVGQDGTAEKLIGISRDITFQKKSRQELLEAAEALRESEQRFIRFTRHLPGLAWIKDMKGRYIYVNEVAERAFGIPADMLMGRSDAEIFPPETAAQFHENDREAALAESGIQRVESLVHPDGSLHYSLVSKFPIPDVDGKMSMIGGMAIDITERMQMEQALLQADRRKDEFLATLAHELRNPLAPIRSSLQFLRMSVASDPEALRVHEILEHQVEQMVRLVDDLLEISRIAGGKVELRREHVALEGILQQAIETSRPMIDAAGHTLLVDLAEGPVEIEADAVRLAQVVANILNNAAKYTGSGGTIRLKTMQEDTDAVISIRDNGVGIHEDALPRLFDMFAQADRSMQHAQGGLGIGLALARSLVELHGGSIEARSDGPGRGSEFIVRLPIGSIRANLTAAPAVESIQPPAPHTPQRILVVDDHRDGADSLAMLLKLLGGETEVAYDGQSAIETVERFRPTIVLLDIGMPGMDGYEVARLIRQRPELDSLRLIALTGWGQKEDRKRTTDAGFDEHWVKPVDAASLRALVGK